MARVKQEIKKQIVEELQNAPFSEADAVAGKWAKRLSKSTRTIYRYAQAAGFESGRKRRSDAETSKAGLNEETLKLIARKKFRSARTFGTKKRIIMPTKVAIEEVERDHNITINASAATVDRHLRNLRLDRFGITRRHDPMNLRSEHPNHVHQFDISVCINYHFEAKGLKIIDLFDKKEIEKTSSFKRKPLRFLLVDHYTGAFFIKYYFAQGESRDLVFDFLHEAWSSKNDLGFPFCGLPVVLYTDKTAALHSKHLENFWKELNITLLTHEAGNPQAKGMVEGWMNHSEQQFESRLREHPPASLEQLNEWVFDWSRRYQATVSHSRYGKSRFVMWSEKIGDMQLRLPPDLEIFRNLVYRAPEKRVVRYGYIRWSDEQTQKKVFVGDFAPHGATVLVSIDLWRENTLRIQYLDSEIQVEIPQYDEAGFPVSAPIIGKTFKRRADPASLRLMKEAEKLPEGREGPLEFPQPKPITYRKVKSRQVLPGAKAPLVPRSDFIEWAVKEHSYRVSISEYNLLKTEYKSRVTREQFPEMLEFLQQRAKESNE